MPDSNEEIKETKSNIDEILYENLLLEPRERLTDRFHEFESYRVQEIEQFIQSMNKKLGRKVYYSTGDACVLGIVLNIEKGILIHLASTKDFKYNETFCFLSNRIMITLKQIHSKCQFLYGESLDLQNLKATISGWFDLFNIPYKNDSKSRKNYPLNIKYVIDKSLKERNGVLMIRPNMEPEYTISLQYGFKCNECLKAGCSYREIIRHVRLHKPKSTIARAYCQFISRGFILCKASENFQKIHDRNGPVQNEYKEDISYFENINWDSKECGEFMRESNNYKEFVKIFDESFVKLKDNNCIPTLLKKRKLLKFYLTEDNDQSDFSFNLNCSLKTKTSIGELIGKLITFFESLKLSEYDKYQNYESDLIDDIIEKPIWQRFVDIIIDIVNEREQGLMRMIVFILTKDYDPLTRTVKDKSFRQRFINIRHLIFIFRFCLRWVSEFENDFINCERLQESLKLNSEIHTLIKEVYYPMVHSGQTNKFLSVFNSDDMSFIHASGWGYHIVGIYSLNMVLTRNMSEIMLIVKDIREQCKMKPRKQKIEYFYKKLKKRGTIELIDKAFKSISLLIIEMMIILNPNVIQIDDYLKLTLKEVSVDKDGRIQFKVVPNDTILETGIDKNVFDIWFRCLRKLYYGKCDKEKLEEKEKEEELQTEEKPLFKIEFFRPIIKNMTNEELYRFLVSLRDHIENKKEWIKTLESAWKLAGEGYITGRVRSGTFATIFGDQYDEFNNKIRPKAIKVDEEEEEAFFLKKGF